MFSGELWAHCASLSPGSHYFLKQAGKNLKNQYPFQRAIEVRVFIICRRNYSECVRSFFFSVRGQTWRFISEGGEITRGGNVRCNRFTCCRVTRSACSIHPRMIFYFIPLLFFFSKNTVLAVFSACCGVGYSSLFLKGKMSGFQGHYF